MTCLRLVFSINSVLIQHTCHICYRYNVGTTLRDSFVHVNKFSIFYRQFCHYEKRQIFSLSLSITLHIAIFSQPDGGSSRYTYHSYIAELPFCTSLVQHALWCHVTECSVPWSESGLDSYTC